MAVTEFGKCLRKMRIDASEVLGTMAGRLGVSSAYLSSIENGARAIPDSFVKKVAQVYGLSEERTRELEEAEAQTRGAVDVDFGERRTEANVVKTAVMFARDFSRLTEQQIAQIEDILRQFEDNPEAETNGSAAV